MSVDSIADSGVRDEKEVETERQAFSFCKHDERWSTDADCFLNNGGMKA